MRGGFKAWGWWFSFSISLIGHGSVQAEDLTDFLTPDEIASELGLELPFDGDDALNASTLELEQNDLNTLLLGLEPSQYKDLERVVVVINKARSGPTSQRIFVYQEGVLKSFSQVKKRDGEVVTREGWPTSTGREKQEVGRSGRKYFSTTPVGYFRPTRLVEKHWSTLWKTYMHHSIFFIGGVAIHATTPDHYKELGTPASGGCARLHPSHAKSLFEWVRAAGEGKVSEISRQGQKTGREIDGHRTLILVRNVAN